MGSRFLLDTDICIFLRRTRQPRIAARFRALAEDEAAISVVTYGELAFGVAKSSQPDAASTALASLLQFLPVLPLPADTGRVYGSIRAALERNGTTIGSNDLWIAAHAVCAGLVLVTNNEREFRRVPGLSIDNWAKA